MLEKLVCISSTSLLLLVFLNTCSSRGDSQKPIVVPRVVEEGFNAKYSPEIPRRWQRHHYGYEAVFTQNNIEYEGEFSADGEWLETEYYVTEKEFPLAVLKKIKKEYPKLIITKYEVEITPKGVFYELDVTDGETEEELYFDEKGNPAFDLYED
jgi:Putative beta-lactamase-inhibitor-like, PepSY-like